jgi:hypothetical protein
MGVRPIRAASFEAIEYAFGEASRTAGEQSIHRAEVMRAAIHGCAIKIANGTFDQAGVGETPLSCGDTKSVYYVDGLRLRARAKSKRKCECHDKHCVP